MEAIAITALTCNKQARIWSETVNDRSSEAFVLTPARRSAIAPFLAMDVLAEARTMAALGHDVMHLEVGEPGSPVPPSVREAVKAALDLGPVGYTQALGLPNLRARIARHYRDTYKVEVPTERVVVTTGSSAGFILAFLASFDVGARVAIARPGYPAYRNILSALGIEPVEIATGRETRYTLTAEMIEKAHAERPLDGVLVMSPANPTGVMMSANVLNELASACRRLGLRFISDEIYHGLTYDRSASTALQSGPEPIVVNSFSKYYCMTGWRVGWLVVPDDLVRPIERLAQNLFISAPYLSQIGAEAAFEASEDLEAIKLGYQRNRALLDVELPRMGLSETLPVDGAFYVYADVSRFTNDAVAFCSRALREAGVAITPGLDFDPVDGSHFVRLSFAGSHASIQTACERLGRWLALPDVMADGRRG